MNNELFNKALGLYLKTKRTELELSYQDVADMLGRKKSWYREIERGRVSAKFSDILIICEALDIDIDELGRFAYTRSK